MTTEDSVSTPPTQMESIKLDNLLINFTTEFQQIWNSTGSSHSDPVAFWHPTTAPDLLPGYFPVGDVIVPDHEDINEIKVVAVVREADLPSEDPARGKALSRPDDYVQVWQVSGSPAKKNCTLWRPIPPEGYVALGLVCSTGEQKPSVHAVRCIRADLVIESYIDVGKPIWSDNRGFLHHFNAWNIKLPTPEAGEIYFAAGTFASSGRPAVENTSYALRMKIQVQTNTAPEVPVTSSFEAPVPPETSEPTQVALIPWFAVDAYPASNADALSGPTYFRLERKDRYRLVGHGHNTGDKSRLFKWKTPGAVIHEKVRTFSSLTSIKFGNEWRADTSDDYYPIQFSAKLSPAFTRTETSLSGWTASNTLVIAAIVPKNKLLAVYQLESQYELLSEHGTQVMTGFAYNDEDSLLWIEHPSEKDSEVLIPEPVTEPSVVTDTSP